MQLEKMGEFFDNRLEGYEEHQLCCIDFAREFYPYTASCLPASPGCRVLDLGCGTGLELDEYLRLNPAADITGIDLAPGMLNVLRGKYPGKRLTLINASYFDTPFGVGAYDAAVSAESLHHFTQAEKAPLYEKLCRALKDGGYFILTDYFADDEAVESANFRKLAQLKRELPIGGGEFYHYDTPLTVGHETEALLAGGFARVELLRQWGSTATLKAVK